MRHTRVRWYFALPVLASFVGCGSNGISGTGVKPDKAAIIIPPYSQNVPLGQPATFKVIAVGAEPLRYQWSENGSPISGATSASFATPDVTISDNGSTFTVTVSNSINSVTSSPATITIGPRSPKSGDLRFKQVDAPSTLNFSTVGGATNIVTNSRNSYTNATGTPLELSYGNCYPGVPLDCG